MVLILGWAGKERSKSEKKMEKIRDSHRDKSRVQMPAKIFPHLKVKC
jgi:hypothetical protein